MLLLSSVAPPVSGETGVSPELSPAPVEDSESPASPVAFARSSAAPCCDELHARPGRGPAWLRDQHPTRERVEEPAFRVLGAPDRVLADEPVAVEGKEIVCVGAGLLPEVGAAAVAGQDRLEAGVHPVPLLPERRGQLDPGAALPGAGTDPLPGPVRGEPDLHDGEELLHGQ